MFNRSKSNGHGPPGGQPSTNGSSTPVAEPVLPRNLLVGLHAVAKGLADVRHDHEDDVELVASLDRVLGRLDGVVRSIYAEAVARAAKPQTNSVRFVRTAAPTNGFNRVSASSSKD